MCRTRLAAVHPSGARRRLHRDGLRHGQLIALDFGRVLAASATPVAEPAAVSAVAAADAAVSAAAEPATIAAQWKPSVKTRSMG